MCRSATRARSSRGDHTKADPTPTDALAPPCVTQTHTTNYENPAELEPAPGPPRRRPQRPLAGHAPVRFPSETIERVKDVAGAEGVTVSAWIRRAIDEKLHRLAEERPDSGG